MQAHTMSDKTNRGTAPAAMGAARAGSNSHVRSQLVIEATALAVATDSSCPDAWLCTALPGSKFRSRWDRAQPGQVRGQSRVSLRFPRAVQSWRLHHHQRELSAHITTNQTHHSCPPPPFTTEWARTLFRRNSLEVHDSKSRRFHTDTNQWMQHTMDIPNKINGKKANSPQEKQTMSMSHTSPETNNSQKAEDHHV